MIIGRRTIAPFVLRPPLLQFRQQCLEWRIDVAEHLLLRPHLVGSPYPLFQQAARSLAPHTIRDAALLPLGMTPSNPPAIVQCGARRFLGRARLAYARFSHQRDALRARPFKRNSRARSAPLMLCVVIS